MTGPRSSCSAHSIRRSRRASTATRIVASASASQGQECGARAGHRPDARASGEYLWSQEMNTVALIFIGVPVLIAVVLGPFFGAEDRPAFIWPDKKPRRML